MTAVSMLSRPRWIAGAALLASPIAAVILLRACPSLDRPWMHGGAHFYAVSLTALLAAFACAGVLISARSLRETRLLFLALAFLSIAAIFAVHGLATPGFLFDEPYPSLRISAWLSVFIGAFFVAASAVELPERAAVWLRPSGAARRHPRTSTSPPSPAPPPGGTMTARTASCPQLPSSGTRR